MNANTSPIDAAICEAWQFDLLARWRKVPPAEWLAKDWIEGPLPQHDQDIQAVRDQVTNEARRAIETLEHAG